MRLFGRKGVLSGSSQRLKKLPDGRMVFYPILFGRGYIVASEKRVDLLCTAIAGFNLLCIASFFLLHWHFGVWGLVVLPLTWVAYMVLTLYILKDCPTITSETPPKTPDMLAQVVMVWALLNSCLFGILFYLKFWPETVTICLLIWCELLVVAAGFAFKNISAQRRARMTQEKTVILPD